MLYSNPLSKLDARWNPIPASWERQVASSEERVAKFLKRLLEHRTALEVAQSLSAPSPQHASRIPGGSSVSLSAMNKRWDMIPHSAEGQRALLPEDAKSELASYQNHIENCIGAVKLPVGIAGPLRVRGMFASGDYYVPLATTEAALVASYSRGAQVITEAGGCVSVLLNEGVSRTPGFAFRSLVSAGLFSLWCIDHSNELKTAAAQTSAHAELADLGVAVEGNHVYLLLEFTTGDASGQNMATIAAQAVCNFIRENSPLKPEYSFVEANFSGDKKATAHSFTTVRGKKVSAEVTLPAELLEHRLHTTPKQLEQYWKMSAIGAIQSGSIGVQGHFANALAALYIACGQDPACVAESAVGVTRMELDPQGDLYASVTLPSIMVGTVGGGTALPTQRACLEIMGLAGAGHARALAEVCGALALAGEISLTSAICANEFSRAHQKLARGRQALQNTDNG
jgi:hydroxymethylglutaryl-CoA reductase (NADPH)